MNCNLANPHRKGASSLLFHGLPALAVYAAIAGHSGCKQAAPGQREPVSAELSWRVVGGSEGASATLLQSGVKPLLLLGCRLDSDEFVVEVPGFTLIASEERLSFGFNDNDPLVLAVDFDWRGAGIRATVQMPKDIFAKIITADRIGISYGRYKLGPYPAPSESQKNSMALACASHADPTAPRGRVTFIQKTTSVL